MSVDYRDGMPEVRRRPKDRKAQIARVAAEAFSDLGFHAVSMEDIATRVGVSAPALYRHSPSKYHLFRDAVFGLSQQLVDCTGFAEAGLSDDAEGPGEVADPVDLLDRLIAALIEVAVVNRTSGGVYRWGGRYLVDDDETALMSQMKLVNLRLQAPLQVLRPKLDSRQRWVLSVGVLSVIGSIVDHRTALATGRIQRLMACLATALLRAEVFEHAASFGEGRPENPQPPGELADTGRYEAVLRESMVLFHKRGYRETTLDDIAVAVGMPTSGIYRYFPGKADILAALFRRAADRLAADTAAVLAGEPDPGIALRRLVESYVARSFDCPEIDYLYFAERNNLPASDGAMIHNMQRATVDTWARLLTSIHQGLSDREARFVVQAAFALVVDLGRLADYQNTAVIRSVVGDLMLDVLLAPATLLTPARA
ncbi:MAG TPA: TetR/AcrR family transcriptional regulator [Mycobacterium sp.]|nr:TetR/AcrR family transcriptional regulator [Mycobacterium sp.]